MPIPFLKMHGLGNDYIYVDAFNSPALATRRDLPTLARQISDRHFGVGSDGLILVCKPSPEGRADGAQVRMRMFNADGSEAEMCGNGVRCVAKFAYDRLGFRTNPILVETERGVLSIRTRANRGKMTRATVDMGEPILELKNIPVERSRITRAKKPFEWMVEADGVTIVATFVSMGNPHAVVFLTGYEGEPREGRAFERRSLEDVDLMRVGPVLESHDAFPSRMNIHFVEVDRKSEASMITWERGSGPTLACGTGACAVLVAGVLTGRLSRSATINLPGGKLAIEWDERTNHVHMSGPASEVFEGIWPTSVPARKGARRG